MFPSAFTLVSLKWEPLLSFSDTLAKDIILTTLDFLHDQVEQGKCPTS